MSLINNLISNLTFKDTVFLKETSDLSDKLKALIKLNKEYPNNENIEEELCIVKKGLEGENEIKYQLSKANIGLYVLHDINIEFEDLKAQIDYIVITKCFCYFIECKNLLGNITVTEKGDFIREYSFKNRKIKKGMYSPLRQVEAQRDVYKKIWNTKFGSNPIISSIKRLLVESSFKDIHRVIVVAANNETILNTKYAPADIKYKVIKADALVRQIQYDLNHSNKSEWTNKAFMEKWAKTFLNINVEKQTDYYEYYRNIFVSNDDIKISDEKFKNLLVEFRKKRSNMMNIPAYYVFTNEELDKIVEVKPRTMEELKSSNILNTVKIKSHGEQILDEINNILDDN